jgi:hypothetical protein
MECFINDSDFSCYCGEENVLKDKMTSEILFLHSTWSIQMDCGSVLLNFRPVNQIQITNLKLIN